MVKESADLAGAIVAFSLPCDWLGRWGLANLSATSLACACALCCITLHRLFAQLFHLLVLWASMGIEPGQV